MWSQAEEPTEALAVNSRSVVKGAMHDTSLSIWGPWFMGL